ncbi:MAG: hypothetical protein EOL95_08085, partial [Bacteroidia bacterium]|nr:hypothetical protein [Bacteroidia bacterium]
FVSWSDANTESTRSITVTGAVSLSASFAIDTYTVSVLKSGTGGSVSGGGTFNYGTSITIKATPYAGYNFKQWNDGSTTASRTIIVTEDIAYIAQFEKQQYTLTISAGANGTVNSEVNGIYDFGTSINIIATPAANASFVSWSDGNVNASRSITINNDIVLEAQFAINNYTLNISALANGTVNTEVNGTYPSGSNITIKATPNAHYHFSKWSDGDKNAQRVLTLTQNTVLYAIFAIDTHSLLITSNGNGSVNSEVNKDYTYGTSVEIKATPNEHADFVSWSDGNTNPIRTIVMNDDITLSASFSLKQYELQVSSGSNGTVNSEASGNYVYGSIISLKAIANEHYHFDSWSDGTTNAEYDIVITKDENLTASFAIDRFELAIVTDNNKGSVNSEVNGEYDYNTPVTIIAQPNVGFTFKYWSDGNTNSERIVNMTENISLSAIFEITHYTLNISAVGNGTVNTEVNGVYDYGTDIEIVVTANNHCHLESWSDGSTEVVRTITLVSDSVIVAYIEPDHFTISASTSGAGYVEGTGTYEYNSEITITAVPDANNHFTVWSDGEANNERTVIVTSDMHFAANFAIDKHTINVVAGEHGVVNSGVNGNYDYGTQLTIIAAANLHYHFDSWSDGSVEIERIIELTQDTTLTANFAIDQFTVSSVIVGNGNIEGAGVYDYGTNVTITAVPDAHNHFVSWLDGDINPVRQIALISDTTMTAEFAIDKYTVTLVSNGNGSVEGAGDFDYNSEITIKAIPNDGYTFDGWSDGNMQTERVITVNGNVTYTASFKETVSVEDATLEKPNVYAKGRTIYIIAPNANSIIVYDKIGKIRGTNVESITVPYAGVYFVKIDGKTYKLTVY